MDTVEILKTALEFELKGAKFYLNTARKVKDISGKDILIRLALDELDHYEILSAEMSEIQSGKQWKDAPVNESVIEKLIAKLPERLRKEKGQYNLSEIDALESALEQERKSKEYYEEQAKNIKEPAAKSLFTRLAKMEEAHYILIQAEIDNLKGTGFWIGFQEFDME